MPSTNLEIAEHEYMQENDLEKCEVCRAYFSKDDMFYVVEWDEWFCESHIETAVELMKKENEKRGLHT